MKSKLAIIILNYNDYKMTIECVDDLIKKNVNYTIVIVDNKSLNNSFNILCDKYKNNKNINVISSNYNKGYAYGNNFGVKFLKSRNIHVENICIMNPDITVKGEKIFDNLIELKEKYSLAGITGINLTNGCLSTNTLGWKLPKFKEILFGNLVLLYKIFQPKRYDVMKLISKDDVLVNIDAMQGCFFIMDNEIFNEIGYFDERTFLYYEEDILSSKCMKNGYKFGLSLENFYFHNHKDKDFALKNFRNLYKHRKIYFNSQKIYCKYYLKNNFIKELVLGLTRNINLYIELPIYYLKTRLKSKNSM